MRAWGAGGVAGIHTEGSETRLCSGGSEVHVYTTNEAVGEVGAIIMGESSQGHWALLWGQEWNRLWGQILGLEQSQGIRAPSLPDWRHLVNTGVSSLAPK